MRIGIDLYALDPEYSGGGNTFALGLSKGLMAKVREADSLVIIVSDKNEKYLKAVFAQWPVSYLKVATNTRYQIMNRLLWGLAWVSRNFKLRFWYDKYFRSNLMREIDEAIDVVVNPTLMNFYALNASSILCIHDIQQEYHPEFFSLRDRISRWAPYRLSCWRAGAIQVSSLYVKNCLAEKFKFIKPENVFLAYEGVDLDKFTTETQIDRPGEIRGLEANSFLYYPAQLWPHKNHLLLVDALANFRNMTGFELPCVLSGHDFGHWKLVQEKIIKHQIKNVYFLGRVRFEQVLWLYQNCKAVLALGLHESSSLPVREGAVFGKPLICSDIPPNIEAGEFFHLRLVDKAKPDSLVTALLELTHDAEKIINNSRVNAKLVNRFGWVNIADDYISILNRLRQKR